MKAITIPPEVADDITLASLKDAREYMQSELSKWRANPKTPDNPQGYWMHPDDVEQNQRLIPALDLIIDYYGG